ncbi:hypothetical protein ACHAWF_018125 [Thalassiosira exigua]
MDMIPPIANGIAIAITGVAILDGRCKDPMGGPKPHRHPRKRLQGFPPLGIFEEWRQTERELWSKRGEEAVVEESDEVERRKRCGRLVATVMIFVLLVSIILLVTIGLVYKDKIYFRYSLEIVSLLVAILSLTAMCHGLITCIRRHSQTTDNKSCIETTDVQESDSEMDRYENEIV